MLAAFAAPLRNSSHRTSELPPFCGLALNASAFNGNTSYTVDKFIVKELVEDINLIFADF